MANPPPLLMLPGPTNVPDRVMAAMGKPMINHRGSEFRKLYERILSELKYAFQTRNDVFPVTVSGTGGIECAAGNVVTPGQKILVPTYGVFSQRFMEAMTRYQGVTHELPYNWGSCFTASDIKEFLDTHKDISAVAVVYNETSTGVTGRELPEIGKLTKSRGILFIVDAVSALGGVNLPVDEWNIDVCITGSQKCLAAPPGLAMISVSPAAYEVMEKNKHRPFYFDLIAHRDYAARLETPFTPAVSLFYALEEALQMLREEGLENRIRRHEICASTLYAGFERMGLKLLADERCRSNTVIAVHKPEGLEDKQFRGHLLAEHGVAIGGGMGKLKEKIFRVGSMGIVSPADILRTLQAFAATLKHQGYSAPLDADDMLAEASKDLSSLR